VSHLEFLSPASEAFVPGLFFWLKIVGECGYTSARIHPGVATTRSFNSSFGDRERSRPFSEIELTINRVIGIALNSFEVQHAVQHCP
jgi:hypothetical protein